MTKETEERMNQLEVAAADAAKTKMIQADKKNRLKQIIDKDTQDKMAYRVRSNDLNKSSDF